VSDSVLVVDDSLTVRMDLAGALTAAGLHAVPCPTLEDARTAMHRERFSLVILDVLLPDGDGVEFLRELRAPDAEPLPVILLSTEAEVRDRVRGLSTGADDYVGKPYDTNYIVARVHELVRRDRRDRGATAEKSTILVIDDSLTFRAALCRALESAGYATAVAGTGEEGLRIAADLRPTAILVDGELPGIHGATVVRQLRLDAALRKTPCLLLTAAEDPESELRALDAGADAFARKGDDVAVILARLAAVLRSARGTAAGESTASVLGPMKILAVDDSPTYASSLSDLLRAEGYDVVVASSGEEALALLAVQSVDCILLDLVMPGLGGEETCRRIKATPRMRDTPLILLTALDDRAAMLRGLSAGADDYIAKSGDATVLKARVLAQLRRKQFEDENRRFRDQLLRMELEAADARAARALAETKARLLEDLERKNQELEAFAYSVSHDLRAPLRSIDGFSYAILEDHAETLDARGQDYLRRIRAATARMGELIDDMLELSRVGRAEMKRERVDLSKLARTVGDTLARAQPDRKVELRVPDGIVADGDRRLCQILFENLLGNAWKFTAKTAQASIELGTGIADETGQPLFFVKDNGVGFDMNYASKLFTPFQRLHGEAEFPGTGIGLATVRRIVDRHGGEVWAEGKVGEGATVFWTLPPRSGEPS
jgi:DNA-binding response OmpR family regulator